MVICSNVSGAMTGRGRKQATLPDAIVRGPIFGRSVNYDARKVFQGGTRLVSIELGSSGVDKSLVGLEV